MRTCIEGAVSAVRNAAADGGGDHFHVSSDCCHQVVCDYADHFDHVPGHDACEASDYPHLTFDDH